MDMNLVFAKTALGEEAVQQSTRVVQRNLRMVLVQVDGSLSVADLAAKIGNPSLVASALKTLESEGLIRRSEGSIHVSKRIPAAGDSLPAPNFSRFSEMPAGNQPDPKANPHSSLFSTFGKPILPVVQEASGKTDIDARSRALPDVADEPVKSGKRQWVFGLLALLLVSAILAAFFLPDALFRQKIENDLSRLLGQPVRVSSVGLEVMPAPALVLSGLQVGEITTLKKVSISSPSSLFLGGLNGVSRISVTGAAIEADALIGFASSLKPLSALSKVSLQEIQVKAGALSLGNMNGSLDFSAGALQKMQFQSADRSLKLDFQPVAQGMALSVEAFGWHPAPGASFIFVSLLGKGLLQPGKLVLKELDASALGGVIKGNLMLNWAPGQDVSWVGDASLERLSAKQVMAVVEPRFNLDGEIAGVIRGRARGADFKAVQGSLEATLDLDMKRGVFAGIDLGEIARRGTGQTLRSGTTRFDHLQAEVQISPQHVQARNIRLGAGMLSAQGGLLVSNARVEGNLVVNMQTSVASRKTAVNVSGVLPDLVASTQAGRGGEAGR